MCRWHGAIGQGRIHKVGCEHQVLLAGKNFLDASVVVEIHIPMFVLLDEGINVLSIFLGALVM